MTHQRPEMFARSGILWLGLAILQAVIAVACIEVNGGAAELSWALYDFEGKRLDEPCTETNIARIRLNWKAVDSDADTSLVADAFKDFECEDNRGVTNFTIRPGRQMLWIQPLCPDGMPPPGNYEVPPPIVRTVNEGTVTTLDALLVVADECTCLTPASCTAAAVPRP